MQTMHFVPPAVLALMETEPLPERDPDLAPRATLLPRSAAARLDFAHSLVLLEEPDSVDVETLERLLTFVRVLPVELGRAVGLGEDELTSLRVLALVADRPSITATEIGHALGISRSRANLVVLALVARGDLEHHLSVRDRRRRDLVCSSHGVARAEEHRGRLASFGQALFGHLGPEGRRRLRIASQELLSAVERSRTRRAGERPDQG